MLHLVLELIYITGNTYRGPTEDSLHGEMDVHISQSQTVGVTGKRRLNDCNSMGQLMQIIKARIAFPVGENVSKTFPLKYLPFITYGKQKLLLGGKKC